MKTAFPISATSAIFTSLILPSVFFVVILFLVDATNEYYLFFTALASLLTQVLGFHILYTMMRARKIDPRRFIKPLKLGDKRTIIQVTLYLLAASFFSFYLLYLPLAQLFPSLVDMLVLDASSVSYALSEPNSVILNIIVFLSIVVMAPIFEEYLFRGVLLQRWSQKWNVRKAIIVSSLIFGILHTDIIGAFLYGVVMSLLYLKTQSLLVPILCHMLNNLVAWALDVGFYSYYGYDYVQSIEDFQNEWWPLYVFGAITLVWTLYYYLTKSRLALKKPVKVVY